jgi:CheY-like chemotaxis protein
MKLNEATLLVVDDEPELCGIVAGWFEKEGCRVLTAHNGAQALKLLESERVHAIVTDVRMPEMDGRELVKRAKAFGQYTPATVAISGFSDLAAREAYDLGIEEQLAKPVQRRSLISAVRKSLTDREQLWAEPFRTINAPIVKLQFESLFAATRKKQILFGHGGFCLSSRLVFPEASTLGFELSFQGEGQLLSLQGIVRWSARDEQLAGIEILRVAEQGRAWVAALARSNQTFSFIPRST